MRAPQPMDPIDRSRFEARQRIERYGFTKLIIGSGECSVPGCDCEPELHPYAYTLGMHTHGSPDFVTFGLPMSKVSAVVDPVCERAMRGSAVPIGTEHRTQVAHGAIVSLVPVPDAWVGYDPGRVGAWFDLFAPQFPSFVQIFWADEAGRMPWEPACNPAVAVMQPLLFEDPLSVPTQGTRRSSENRVLGATLHPSQSKPSSPQLSVWRFLAYRHRPMWAR